MRIESPRATLVALLGLTAVGVVTHAMPHGGGFSTVGGVGMLAAALLPRVLVPIPVLVTVLAVDAVSGFYAIWAMLLVYGAHALAAVSVSDVLQKITGMRVLSGAALSAVVFFLVSNLSQMALGFYDNTLAGWIQCYVAALPFLFRELLANLVFGGGGLLAVVALRRAHAHRLTAA